MEEAKRRLLQLNPNFKIWKKYDVLFFYIVIPAILTLIFLLPQSIKDNYLILYPLNPTLLSMFFSNYVHTDLFHLLGNLILYLIIVSLLFNLESDKKFFYLISVLLLILLPFIVSLAVIYLIPTLPNMQGFSAIVTGFIGYLLYAVYVYLKNVHKIPLDQTFILLILGVNLTIVAIFNLPAPSPLKLAITMLFTIILVYINWRGIQEISTQAILKLKNPTIYMSFEGGYTLVVAILVSFFLFSLRTLMPSEIKIGNSVINILAHYVGYIFGACIPFVVETVISFKQTNVPR